MEGGILLINKIYEVGGGVAGEGDNPSSVTLGGSPRALRDQGTEPGGLEVQGQDPGEKRRQAQATQRQRSQEGAWGEIGGDAGSGHLQRWFLHPSTHPSSMVSSSIHPSIHLSSMVPPPTHHQ